MKIGRLCWICVYYQRDKKFCKLHNGRSDYYDACLEFKDSTSRAE